MRAKADSVGTTEANSNERDESVRFAGPSFRSMRSRWCSTEELPRRTLSIATETFSAGDRAATPMRFSKSHEWWKEDP